MIAEQAAAYAVADLCQTLDVSRSGYYAWRQRRPAADPWTPRVKQVFWRHSRRYGSRRITAELQAQGYEIGRRRVRRILGEQELRALQPKSFVPRTTNSRHGGRMSPNLLEGLVITRPHQVFVSDITYLPLLTGQWAYLATWMDLYSRKITGWQVAESMTAAAVGHVAQLVHRIQDALAEFRQLLAVYGYQQSMSRAGETYDNVFAESLFSRYKAELLEDGAFRDAAEAQLETFDYIERYYNPIRRHSALGYVSPEEYERAYYQRAKAESLIIKERTQS